MKKKMLFQQGDVLIYSVDPKEITGEKKNIEARARGFVLADGEVTGHAHVIQDPNVKMFNLGNKMFMECSKTVTVVHEEHNPIEIPAGTYEIGRVQEYDHFTEEARQVRD